MSSSDNVGWIEGLIDNPVSSITTLGAVAIGGVATIYTGGVVGAVGGLLLGGEATGASEYLVSKTGIDYKQGVKAWLGQITKAKPNYITIVKAQQVAQYCTIS